MTLSPLPRAFARYFWDAEADQIDMRQHRRYIIERILEIGDLDALRWLFRTYTEGEIQAVVQQSRVLSRPAAVFWANFFGLNPEEIPCIQRHYLPKQ